MSKSGDAFGQAPFLFPSVGATCAAFVFTRTLSMPSFCVAYGLVDENQHSPMRVFGWRICAAV